MTLGELFDIAKGKKPTELFASAQDGAVRLLQIEDLRAGATPRFCRNASAMVLCERDDVVLAWDGAHSGIAASGLEGACGSTLARLRPKTTKTYTPFVVQFLATQLASIQRNRTGATIPHVNGAHLRSLDIPLLALSEQKRIAAILEAAEKLRLKRRESMRQLDLLTQASFLEMFGDPVANPKAWSQVDLGSLVEADDRINYGVVQPGGDCPGGIPLIRVGDFATGTLDASAIKLIEPQIEARYARSRLKGTELLVSCVGSIGVVCKVSAEHRGFNIARAVARVPLCDGVSRDFVMHCLRAAAVQRHFIRETRTVSQPTLNIALIKTAPVIVPPFALQERFASISQVIEQQKGRLASQLAELDRLFASLQARAFGGELCSSLVARQHVSA